MSTSHHLNPGGSLIPSFWTSSIFPLTISPSPSSFPPLKLGTGYVSQNLWGFISFANSANHGSF